MTVLLIALVALWILLQFKTSRPDGTLVPGLHPYRRLMPYIMEGRNESVVYFDIPLDAEALLRYLAEARKSFDADVTQCIVAASAIIMAEVPKVNRFVSGRRLYQRKGTQITFSMKRRKLDREAKLAVVKLEVEPGETFRTLCERINAKIDVERSEARTYADKEMDLLSLAPRPLLRAAVTLLRTLDYYNLLPARFIENDGMYTSVFCANLGSLDMAAGFHHLFEWGNCPIFAMAGKIEERPVVVDGEVVVRRILPMRWSYDERTDDGLNARFAIEVLKRVLENPYEQLGCLAPDGSDARPLDQGAVPG